MKDTVEPVSLFLIFYKLCTDPGPADRASFLDQTVFVHENLAVLQLSVYLLHDHFPVTLIDGVQNMVVKQLRKFFPGIS